MGNTLAGTTHDVLRAEKRLTLGCSLAKKKKKSFKA